MTGRASAVEPGNPAELAVAASGTVALRRSPHRAVQALLFAVLFLTSAYFFHAEAGWNVNSRICLTYAIVEKCSFAIDDYQKIDALRTEDIAFFDGHYYSDKIIGTSLLGVVPMAVLHTLSRLAGRDFSWDTKRYVVRTFSVSVAGALAGVLLYRLLVLLGASASGALGLVLLFFFATQFFSVNTVFLSYAPALCFALLSYATLLASRDRLDGRAMALSGLALGAAMLCEYTIGIIAAGLVAYAFYHLRRKALVLLFCLCAFLPLTVFLAYTYACFGRPAIPYEYLVREEFRKGMSQGFQGIVRFDPTVLYYITVHRYRGLFYHSPFLALALWGWVAMWRERRWRSDAFLSIAIVAAYLAFNSSYYMWWGGWTNGPRHLIPALPFLIVPLVWVWRSGATGRALLIALGLVGVFFNTLPAMVEAQIPQGYQAAHLYHPKIAYNYRDMLWEVGVKGFLRGDLARNAGHLIGLRGHVSLVPLVLIWLLVGGLIVRLLRRSRETTTAPS